MSARANKRPVAVTAGLLRRWPLPQPGGDADKADRGVAIVAGGSAEIPGALLLAGGCRALSPRKAREAALRENLSTLRSTIRQYHGDKGIYPASLRDLVAEGYIRSIPVDPLTRSRESWRLTYQYPGTPSLTFPCWRYQDYLVWGLTMRILTDLFVIRAPP